MSFCQFNELYLKERCAQELKDLRKHQTEQVQLLLQQQEEKEKKLVLENQKKLEESVQRMRRENRVKEEALKAENERILSLLIQENERQEASMLAKHEGEVFSSWCLTAIKCVCIRRVFPFSSFLS